jgi:hypothetical protein
MNGALPTEDDARSDEDRSAAIRARWRFTLLPILALGLLLAVFAPFGAVGWIDYAAVVPVILTIAAIVVFFIGSWYDFGAKSYVRSLLRASQPVTDADLDWIHREQFILTLCYGGVAGLYVVIAVAIAFL